MGILVGISISLLVGIGLAGSCSKDARPTILNISSESELRSLLGVPPDAQRVIIFGQNAHMDLDWLFTFEEYYDKYVEEIIGDALHIIDDDPRYYYAMAEMAFLEYHLKQHPEDLVRLKRHARSGQFRIVGGGLTSPDVILPTGESLLRDFLYGRRFTLDTLGVMSETAWLPDDFGLGMNLPTVLEAAGYRYAALSRSDGIDNFTMPNMDYVPRPGSTAEKLLNANAVDFYWVGGDGTKILTHWMPFTYCQGDGIDSELPFNLPGTVLGSVRSDAEFTNSRIHFYLSKMKNISPTDYIFVPVGCDFAPPKPLLTEYMDNWNASEYPATGVWAVAATFEDFARLVEFQKDRVPEFEVDITPYWMGFFGTRVELKKLHRQGSYVLEAAEKIATLNSLHDDSSYPASTVKGEVRASTDYGHGRPYHVARASKLRELWKILAWSNHHDYLPGTSPDAVYYGEQLPLLQKVVREGEALLNEGLALFAEKGDTSGTEGIPFVVWNPLSFERGGWFEWEGDVSALSATEIVVVHRGSSRSLRSLILDEERDFNGVLTRVRMAVEAPAVPAMGYGVLDIRGASGGTEAASDLRVEWSWEDGSSSDADSAEFLTLANGKISLRFAKSKGWSLDRIMTSESQWLAGVGFDVVSYADDGGLWRLGHEMDNCSFTRKDRAGANQAEIRILSAGPARAGVSITSTLQGGRATREVWLAAGDDKVYLSVTAQADSEVTLTGLFETRLANPRLTMATPFAWAERLLERHYDPTYWPVLEWLDVADLEGSGLLIVSPVSQGWHVSESGEIEFLAVRNAPLEKCAFLGTTGNDHDPHEISFWLIPHSGEMTPETAYRRAFDLHQPLRAVATSVHEGTLAVGAPYLEADGGIYLTTLKRAESGEGLVLRLFNPSGSAVEGRIRSVLPDFGFDSFRESTALEENRGTPKPLGSDQPIRVDRHVTTFVLE